MELCWIVPWYRALTRATAAVPLWEAVGWLGLMILTPIYLTRALNFLEAPVKTRRRILGVLLFLSLFAGLRLLLYRGGGVSLAEMLARPIRAFADVRAIIPDELVVFLIVLFAWWRGVRLAAVPLSPTRARFGFLFGFIVYVGFFFMVTLSTGETPGPLMPLFFFASLIALGLTRVDSLRRLRGARLPFGPAWMAFLLVSDAAIVGTGAALGEWLTGGLEPLLTALLGALIIAPIAIILTPMAWLLLKLLQWIAGGLEGLAFDMSPAIEALQGLLGNLNILAQRLAELLPFGNLAPKAPYIKLALTASLVAGMFLLVLFALRRIRQRTPGDQTEQHESAFSSDLLLASLRELWAGALGRLGETGALLGRFGLGSELFAALNIRRMYLHALRLAAEQGHPRGPAETPLEFLPTLGRAFPGREPDGETLTWAYMGVRYGELPDSAAGLEPVRAAYDRLRAQAEEQGKERRSINR